MTRAGRCLAAGCFLGALLAGCGGGSDTSAAAPLGFAFVERSSAAGIAFRHTDGSSGQYYIVETLASGVGLLDYDDDGDLDVYFPNGRPLPPTPQGDRSASNALYQNDGRGSFTDVTAQAGVPGVGFSVGCCAGDYDGDGDLDLYVAGFGHNVLYRNEGEKSGWTFADVTREAGVDDTRFSAGCAFLDYDRDGDLDLYVSNYCEVDFATSKPCLNNGVPGYCAPGKYKPVHDSLFENRGDGTFEDVSVAAGVVSAPPRGPGPKWGMGVCAVDFNDDGWTDVYVANDVSDNFLLENQKNGTFRHVAMDLGCALGAEGTEQGSMGVDAGDFDRDGRLDIVVTNFQKQLNALYHQDAHGFTDEALAKGLGHSTLPKVSWGTRLFDADCDGWLDLFIANGHLEDRIDEYDDSSRYLQENQFWLNRSGAFEEVSGQAGPALAEKLSSRGAAFGDIDNDGDVDIVVSNSRARPSLLTNERRNDNAWVRLKLRGKKNRFAIGARVRLTAGGATQLAYVQSGGSYCSQNDLRLHFGLGRAQRIDRVEVRWPEGGTSTYEGLGVDTEHLLEE